MRLQENPTLPQNPESAYDKALNRVLLELLRSVSQKVNQLADGRFAARDLTAATVPTTGMYAVGDFVANSAPAELGVSPNKYVIEGWLCILGGTPGTFVQKRFLTGN